MNEDLNVPQEFIEEDKANLGQFMPKSRRRGPYSKKDKEARRNEVYRLHFEYGYSARKIADLMKVDRNTINGDLDYWYSKILKNMDIVNPEYSVIITLERMEIQRTRLREQLDKIKNNPERIAIERLIYDVDSKILHTFLKLTASAFRTHKLATEWLNDQMAKNNMNNRNLTFFDTIAVSKKAYQRIRRIINEDRNNRGLR